MTTAHGRSAKRSPPGATGGPASAAERRPSPVSPIVAPTSETYAQGAWRPGDRVGPFEVLRLIGRGGMGEVYAAERERSMPGQPARVALKRLRNDLSDDPKFVELFEHEAAVHALAAHENVVRLLEFARFGEDPVMVLEYVDGVSSRRALEAAKQRALPCPVDGALYLILEVLRGLEHVHALRDPVSGRSLGVVHRDVTPGNVLIGRDGGVRLVDFGVVQSRLMRSGTRPGVLKGKLGYMSPEQILGAELDARSDLFTVGVMLAELLLARRLFGRTTDFRLMVDNYRCDVEQLGEVLPPKLSAIWAGTIRRLPTERVSSARELSRLILQTARELDVDPAPLALFDWLQRLALLPSHSGTFAAPDARDAPAAPRPVVLPAWRSAAPRPWPSLGLSVEALCRIATSSRGHRVVKLGSVAACVATGRLPQGVPIAMADDVRPLAAWLPRAALVTAAAFDFSGSRDGPPLWSRAADVTALPPILFEIVRGRRTGLLVVEGRSARRRAYLSRGELGFVASTAQRELLGVRLVAHRRASPEDVHRALDHGLRRGLSLGEALVDLDLVRPGLVLLELVSQIEDRFIALGRMQVVRVAFFPNAEPGIDAPPPSDTTEGLVCRLVRECFGPEDLERALRPYLEHRARWCSRHSTHVLDGLTPAEGAWLGELARGRQSLRALSAGSASGDRLDLLRSAFLGLSAGLLVPA
jgi:eukaryotic-like serine/threonine-protein kinase